MASALAQHFRSRRAELRLTLPSSRAGLATATPAREPVDSNAWSAIAFATADLVDRAARAMGLDPAELATLADQDERARRADFASWLAVPQPMALYGFVCSVTFALPLPADLGEDQAIDYAIAQQQQRQYRVCLVLDRSRSLWIARDGKSCLTVAIPDQLTHSHPSGVTFSPWPYGVSSPDARLWTTSRRAPAHQHTMAPMHCCSARAR